MGEVKVQDVENKYLTFWKCSKQSRQPCCHISIFIGKLFPMGQKVKCLIHCENYRRKETTSLDPKIIMFHC